MLSAVARARKWKAMAHTHTCVCWFSSVSVVCRTLLSLPKYLILHSISKSKAKSFEAYFVVFTLWMFRLIMFSQNQIHHVKSLVFSLRYRKFDVQYSASTSKNTRKITYSKSFNSFRFSSIFHTNDTFIRAFPREFVTITTLIVLVCLPLFYLKCAK